MTGMPVRALCAHASDSNSAQMDEARLILDDSGTVLSIDAESEEASVVAASFGAFLEKFRDALLGGKLEWASGWVEKS